MPVNISALNKLAYSCFLFCLLVSLPFNQLLSQSAYEHIHNRSLYDFIGELATQHIVEVNTAVKPYTRSEIAELLMQAHQKRQDLSEAQQNLLDIWLGEFALENGHLKQGYLRLIKRNVKLSVYALPPEISFKDSAFRLLVRPIYGIRYINTGGENQIASYGGAEAMASINKSWAFYVSVRDNYQSLAPLSAPSYFSQEAAGNYKFTKGAEFSELRAGITYSWSWGSLGFIKDHIAWGDHTNGSNILSGNTPSFPLIKLKIKPVNWFELNYFHGWLVSEVIDSTRSYYTNNGDFRAVFRQKYIAANLYSFIPSKRLNISVGNAIIYSDVPVQPAYLIPFSFFKSIDHTLNHSIENQNSMMFLNLSSRQFRHLHIYLSAFIDEFSISRISSRTKHNFTSLKGGTSLSGWPLSNLNVNAEYTFSYPNTFEHYTETTTYASNKYNLGHYLRGNSVDSYFSVSYLLPKSIKVKASYNYAVHGNDYAYDYNGPIPVDELPVLKEKSWSRSSFMLHAEYFPVQHLRFFVSYCFDDVQGFDLDGKTAQDYLNKFSPAYLHGKTNSLIIGFNLGI